MAELVADPDVIFTLLALAALAFVFEGANPGMTVPGATGIGLLLAAGIGLSHRPASAWGLITMGLAALLLGAEQLPRSQGAGPVAAVLALMLGGFLLYPFQHGVNRWLLLVLSTIVAGGAVVAARTARRVRYGRRPVHSPGDHRDRVVRLDRGDGHRGQVKLDGTWWTVEAEAPLVAGQPVRITGRRGLVLLGEPLPDRDPHDRPTRTPPPDIAEEKPCQT